MDFDCFFFFSSRRRHTRYWRDWSSDVCSSDLLIGLTTGCTNVVIAAVLAEIYGTRHLGRIRALAGAIMVIASALGPVVAGPLFDIGIGVEAVALGFAAYLATAAAITFALPKPRAERGLAVDG